MKTADNSAKPARKMPKGVPFKKGKGVDPRINRKGAPVRGQSFQEAVKRLADMSREELADYFGRNTPLGHQFLLLPPEVPVRDVLIGRALVTLANDFDARGFEKLADRNEGKPSQNVDITSKGEQIGKTESDIRAEILRKLDSISRSTGAGTVHQQTDE